MSTLKTEEVLSRSALVHRLLGWCRAAKEKMKEVGARRIAKYVYMYGLYLLIVWTFDYLWMPWLAIKFKYFTFFPLYLSLFVVCLLGLFLYDSFKEDIFFKEDIKKWLAEEGKYKFTRWIKRKINASPQATFAAIATWWSPLHAYIYFREGDENHFREVIKLYVKGSFYCAFFWSVVVAVIVFIVGLFGELLIPIVFWGLITILIFIIVRKIKKYRRLARRIS